MKCNSLIFSFILVTEQWFLLCSTSIELERIKLISCKQMKVNCRGHRIFGATTTRTEDRNKDFKEI